VEPPQPQAAAGKPDVPGGAEVRKQAEAEGEQPTREPVEQAERDKKAPLDEPPARPRGGEEAEAKVDAETQPVPNPDHKEGAS
jgi:hypothetical protein